MHLSLSVLSIFPIVQNAFGDHRRLLGLLIFFRKGDILFSDARHSSHLFSEQLHFGRIMKMIAAERTLGGRRYHVGRIRENSMRVPEQSDHMKSRQASHGHAENNARQNVAPMMFVIAHAR